MIVWLEDREFTVVSHVKDVKKRFKYQMLPSPITVASFLEEMEEVSIESIVFIIDIMLLGEYDLAQIGIKNAPLQSGANAGLIFADRFLRVREGRWRRCPIIFLTERAIDDSLTAPVEKLKHPDAGPVHLLSKAIDEDKTELLKLLELYVKK